MRDHMQARLEMLRKELEKGQIELQKVENQRTYLYETILRIRGAIQVLEELLAAEQPAHAIAYQGPPNAQQYPSLSFEQLYAPTLVESQQTPPHPPPRKKHGKHLWFEIAGIFLVMYLACGLGAIAINNAVAAKTSSIGVKAAVIRVTGTLPTTPRALHWTTTHTFSGTGAKNTQLFTVPDNWKLVWKGDPSSFEGVHYNLIISVCNSRGTLTSVALDELVHAGNASGEKQEHDLGGHIALSVISEGSWTLNVQEQK